MLLRDGLCLLSALSPAFPTSTRAQCRSHAGTQPSPPVVVATGQATVRLPPDRAFVTLSTETRAPKPTEAQQRNAQAMAAVQQKLEAARLPKESVRTLAYSLEEEFDYANNRRTSTRLQGRQHDRGTPRRHRRVGEILDLAVAAGATSAHNIRFDLKERAAAERQALRLAVADARARAEAAAAGANATWCPSFASKSRAGQRRCLARWSR